MLPTMSSHPRSEPHPAQGPRLAGSGSGWVTWETAWGSQGPPFTVSLGLGWLQGLQIDSAQVLYPMPNPSPPQLCLAGLLCSHETLSLLKPNGTQRTSRSV